LRHLSTRSILDDPRAADFDVREAHGSQERNNVPGRLAVRQQLWMNLAACQAAVRVSQRFTKPLNGPVLGALDIDLNDGRQWKIRVLSELVACDYFHQFLTDRFISLRRHQARSPRIV